MLREDDQLGYHNNFTIANKNLSMKLPVKLNILQCYVLYTKLKFVKNNILIRVLKFQCSESIGFTGEK
jgi:hypothetical protein